MHALCSHGVFQDQIYLVLEAIHSSGFKIWDTLKEWLGLWVLPQAYQCNVASLFDQKNVAASRKAKSLKCAASECLALYRILQHFLQVMYVANSVMLDQCASYTAWCAVLDYLHNIPYMRQSSPPHLLSLVETALAATNLAGFGEHMKPKYHWCLHFATCLYRWGQLPACWAMERKHKTPRKFGGAHCNLSTYDKGVLSAVTMEHVHTLISLV